MNVMHYLKYYGKYTFQEKPFNEIDNVIFSLLAYTNFSNIVSDNNKKKIRLEDAALDFLSMNGNVITDDIVAIRESLNLLIEAKNTNRFKDVLMYNYRYDYSEDSQFSCLTFEISKRLVYVAFEGTDKLISGWLEDAKMSYEYPVTAHIYAINYLNKYFRFSTKKIIVGGHSKGGNLALVSALGCKKGIYKRIINVYSNDGQGLRKEETETKRYKDIEKKYVHICPYNSIVGLLLRHNMYYISVDSDRKPGSSHSAMSWQVDYDHFKTREVSRFSRILDESMSRWLDKYDYNQLKRFVDSVGKVMSDNGIVTLVDFKNNKRLAIDVLKSTKTMDPIVKEMSFDLIKIIGMLNIEYRFM